jgi:hypothetical protein
MEGNERNTKYVILVWMSLLEREISYRRYLLDIGYIHTLLYSWSGAGGYF